MGHRRKVPGQIPPKKGRKEEVSHRGVPVFTSQFHLLAVSSAGMAPVVGSLLPMWDAWVVFPILACTPPAHSWQLQALGEWASRWVLCLPVSVPQIDELIGKQQGMDRCNIHVPSIPSRLIQSPSCCCILDVSFLLLACLLLLLWSSDSYSSHPCFSFRKFEKEMKLLNVH